MTQLVFLLLVGIVFTWLVVRSVRAGHGTVIFWFAWFLIGLAVVLSLQPPLGWWGELLVQLWAYSLIGLPVWWSVQALRRHNRGLR